MKRKVFGSRLLAGILTLAMVFTLMPTSFVSLAAPADEEITVIAEEGEEEATTEEAGEEIEAGEAEADEVSSFANAAEEDTENGEAQNAANGEVQASDGEDTPEEEAGEAVGLGQAAANETAGGDAADDAIASLITAIKNDIHVANAEHHQKMDETNINTAIDVGVMDIIENPSVSIVANSTGQDFEKIANQVYLVTLNATGQNIPEYTAGDGSSGNWLGAFFPKNITGYSVEYKQGIYYTNESAETSGSFANYKAGLTSIVTSNEWEGWASLNGPDYAGAAGGFVRGGKTYGVKGKSYDGFYFNPNRDDGGTHKVIIGKYITSGENPTTNYVVFDIPFGEELKKGITFATGDLPEVNTLGALPTNVSSLIMEGADLYNRRSGLGKENAVGIDDRAKVSLIQGETSAQLGGNDVAGERKLNLSTIHVSTDEKTITATAKDGYVIKSLTVKSNDSDAPVVSTNKNLGEQTATAEFTPELGKTYTVKAEAVTAQVSIVRQDTLATGIQSVTINGSASGYTFLGTSDKAVSIQAELKPGYKHKDDSTTKLSASSKITGSNGAGTDVTLTGSSHVKDTAFYSSTISAETLKALGPNMTVTVAMGAAEAAKQIVTATKGTDNKVTYSKDNTSYEEPTESNKINVTTVDGITVGGKNVPVSDIYVKVSAGTNGVFASDIDYGVTDSAGEITKEDVTKVTENTTGKAEAIFKIAKSVFTGYKGYIDRTITISISGDNNSKVTGDITYTGGKIKDGEAQVATIESFTLNGTSSTGSTDVVSEATEDSYKYKVNLGASASKKVYFTVSPKTGYVIDDGIDTSSTTLPAKISETGQAKDKVNVQENSSGYVAVTRESGTNDKYGAVSGSVVYSFMAEAGKTYAISATAKAMPWMDKLSIVDLTDSSSTNVPSASDFSITIDGNEYDPAGGLILDPLATHSVVVSKNNDNFKMTSLEIGNETISGDKLKEGEPLTFTIDGTNTSSALGDTKNAANAKKKIEITTTPSENGLIITNPNLDKVDATTKEKMNKISVIVNGTYNTTFTLTRANGGELGSVVWSLSKKGSSSEVALSSLDLKAETAVAADGKSATYKLSNASNDGFTEYVEKADYVLTATEVGKNSVKYEFSFEVTDRSPEVKWEQGTSGKTPARTVLKPKAFKAQDKGYTEETAKGLSYKIFVQNTGATYFSNAGFEAREAAETGVSSESSTAFVVDYTLDSARLNSGADNGVALTIYPATGLNSGTYKADIVFTATGINTPVKLATVSFTVNDSYTITDANGVEYKVTSSTAAGGSGRTGLGDIDLGTYVAGTDPIDDIVLNITGSKAEDTAAWDTLTSTEWTSGRAASDPKVALKGVNAGISGTLNITAYKNNNKQLVIGGKVSLTAYDKTITSSDTAKYVADEETVYYYIDLPVDNGSKYYTGVLKVVGAEYGVSAGANEAAAEALTITGGAGSFAYADTAANNTRTFVVTNKSDEDMVVEAKFAKATTAATTKFTVNGTSSQTSVNLTVPKNGSKSFTITAKTALDFYSDVLTIGPATPNTGFDPVSITVSYSKVGTELDIKEPAQVSDGYNGFSPAIAIDIGKAYLGASYSKAFTGASGTAPYIWDILEARTNTDAGVTTSGGYAAGNDDIFEKYGLMIDSANGLLTGTPLVKTETLYLHVQISDSAATPAKKAKWFKLEVAAAMDEEEGLSAQIVGGSALTRTAGINQTVSVNDRTVDITIRIANNSAVDLYGLTANLAPANDVEAYASYANAFGSNKALEVMSGTKNVLRENAGTTTANTSFNLASDGGTADLTLTIPGQVVYNEGGYSYYVAIRDNKTNESGTGTTDDVIFYFPLKVTTEDAPVITAPDLGTESSPLITVNKAVPSGLRFTAKKSSLAGAASISSANASWSLEADTSNTITKFVNEVPAGITIDPATGELSGTPTVAGNYAVTARVTDTSDGSTGFHDFKLYVAGAAKIGIYGSGTTSTEVKKIQLFNGAVRNSSDTLESARRFDVKTSTAGVTLTNLSVSIADAPGYEGSAAKFSINGNAGGVGDTITSLTSTNSGSFTVAPIDASEAGTYRAVISVDGAQVAKATLEVQFTVTEKLEIAALTQGEMTGNVGSEWEVEFTAAGAGTDVSIDKGGDGEKDKYEQFIEWRIVGEDATSFNTTWNALKNAGIDGIGARQAYGTKLDGTNDTVIRKAVIENGTLSTSAFKLAAESGIDFTLEAYVKETEDKVYSTYKTASQVATLPLKLVINKSGNVYVSYVKANEEQDTKGTASHEYVSEQSESEKITAYAFNSIAASGANVTKTFTVVNTSAVDMVLNAAVANVGTTELKTNVTVTPNKNQTIKAGGSAEFTLTIPAGLEKGDYSVELQFTSTGAKDITIPITFSVTDPVYEVKTLDEKSLEEIGALTIDPSVQGKASKKASFLLYNSGNVDSVITSIEEVKNEAGDAWGTSTSTKKLSSVSLVKAVLSDGELTENGSYTMGTNTNTNKFERGSYLKGTVQLSSYGLSSAVENGEAFIKITWQSKVATGTTVSGTMTTSTVVRVNYTVLNNNVSNVTLTPGQGKTTALEDISESDTPQATEFTVKNAMSGTAVSSLNTLANVIVKLSNTNADDFTLTVPNAVSVDKDGVETNVTADVAGYKIASLPEESEFKFTVVPKSGLVSGSYRVTVNVSADNLASTMVATFTLKVTSSASFAIEVDSVGAAVEGNYAVSGSFAKRFYDTLDAMKGTSGVVATADGFSINLNDTSTTNGLDVGVKKTDNVISLVKLSSNDLSAYENVLTNTKYKSSDLGKTFESITFRNMNMVTVNMSADLSDIYVDGTGKAFTDPDNYGSTDGYVDYSVAYGEAIEGVTGSVSGADGKLGDEISGLPKIAFKDTTQSFDGFFEGRRQLLDTTPVVKDWTVIPEWHEHNYAPTGTTTYEGLDKDGNAVPGIKWVWSEDNKEAVLTLTCLDGDEFSKELSVAKGSVFITPDIKAATDTKKGGTIYTAVATDPDTGRRYTDIKNAGDVEPIGHDWDLSEGKFSVELGEASKVGDAVKVTVTCKNIETHVVTEDGPLQNTFDGKITAIDESKKATDTVDGVIVYTISFKDNNEKEFTVTYSVEDKAMGHVWGDAVFTWSKDYSSAEAVFTCQNDATHTEKVNAMINVSEPDEDGRITYTATATTSDGKKTSTAVQYSYKSSEGVTYMKPSNKDWTFADDGSSASVTLKDSAGNTLVVTTNDVTVSTSGNKTIYTATIKVGTQSFSGKAEKNKDSGEITPISGGGDNSSETVEGLSYTMPQSTFTYTGKAITLDDLRMYWTDGNGETNLLVLNTDYSLKYTGNVNAGKATVTVTGKGDYAGVDATDISFTIEPKDISGLDFTAENVVIKNTAKVKNPVLKWGTKSLKYGTDFDVSYEAEGITTGDKPTAEAGAYTAMITGKGNYTGEKYFYLYIVDSSTVDAKAAQVVIPQAAKNMLKVDPKTGFDYTAFLELIQVKYKGTVLDRDDYSIRITGEPSVGKKNIEVSFDGTNSSKLLGTKYQAITLTGEKLVANNFSAITGKQTVPFKGEAWTWEDVVSELNLDTDKLGNGQAYTVALSNNVKSGTMKVTFTGDAYSWYQGSVSKSIKIGKVQKYSVSINGVDIGTTVDDKVTTGMTTDTEVPMLPGGATIQNLEIRALGDDVLLREKTDYTLSYKNNKTVGGTATVTINGKGNYGKAIFQFKVGKGQLSADTVYITTKDVKYSANKTTFAKYFNANQMPQVTLYANGKKLTRNDFTFAYEVPETFEWDADNGIIVKAKITGTGNYEGEVELDAVHIFDEKIVAKDFTIKPQTYTGSPITFATTDTSVITYSKGNENFEILGFTNNVKKGTAKVTVRGVGKYGGTATLSFKIEAANLGSATK